jgi:hypothetical protein
MIASLYIEPRIVDEKISGHNDLNWASFTFRVRDHRDEKLPTASEKYAPGCLITLSIEKADTPFPKKKNAFATLVFCQNIRVVERNLAVYQERSKAVKLCAKNGTRQSAAGSALGLALN